MSDDTPRSTVRAIETRYAGHRFRSRLEARWAVFFDTLGIDWQYEPEGFELPSGGRYLPDFYLPGIGWVEIKREGLPDDAPDVKRWYEFAEFIDEPAYLIRGLAKGMDNARDGFGHAGDDHHIAVWGDFGYAWCSCPYCGRFGIQFDGRGHRIACGCETSGANQPRRLQPWVAILGETHSRIYHSDKGYTADDPRIIVAYDAAITARFEHGENKRAVKADIDRDVHMIAIDRASEDDRAWFAANPGKKYRFRPSLPHEWCYTDHKNHVGCQPNEREHGVAPTVEVVEIEPGFRLRRHAGYVLTDAKLALETSGYWTAWLKAFRAEDDRFAELPTSLASAWAEGIAERDV